MAHLVDVVDERADRLVEAQNSGLLHWPKAVITRCAPGFAEQTTAGLSPSTLATRMDFFVYSRDASGTEALRNDDDLLEEHWSYMDGFADAMIARGPTLAPDRATPTGSLHVLALPSVTAVTEFVEREPNNRAGVYAEHRIWAFDNLLGRTMWDFADEADEPRFLVIAHSSPTPVSARPVRPAALGTELRERLIVYGTLAEPESGEVNGVAVALQAPGKDAVEELLRDGAVSLDAFSRVEVRDWEFGGRR
jgi:uncharacterized protein